MPQRFKHVQTAAASSIKARLLDVQDGVVTVTVPSFVPGTAIVLPSPVPEGITGQDFTLVAYVGRFVAASTPIEIPVSARYPQVFAVDLPDGFATSFEAISKAIMTEFEPPEPGTTGND